MEFILDAIDNASVQGHCFPAIVTALTVPDIAGAVDAPAASSTERYAKWVEQWFSPRFPLYVEHGIDGFTLYGLRCKLLHEGLTDPSQAPAAAKSATGCRKRLIAFNIGAGLSVHFLTASNRSGDTFTILRAESFCSEITSAAREWVKARSSDAAAMQRLQSLVDIRTDAPGLSSGIPLICAAM